MVAALEGVTIRKLVGFDLAETTFRIKITGTHFGPETRVYIGNAPEAWRSVRFKSSAVLVLTDGRQLRREFPVGVKVAVRVVNPNGDEATQYFKR